MSRAFVKEDGPEDPRLPDLPLSPHPNWVTADGLRALQDRLSQARAALTLLRARPDRTDRAPEAALDRDIRWLTARIASAILTPKPDTPTEAAFATTVTLDDGTPWTLVGEDQADPSRRLLSIHSPLARALTGLAPGDSFHWPPGPRGRTVTVSTVT